MEFATRGAGDRDWGWSVDSMVRVPEVSKTGVTMQQETWLRPNRRALAAGLVIPALLTMVAVALLVGPSVSVGFRVVGGTLLVLAGLLIGAWWTLDRTPRLAYEDGFLIVNLGIWKTYRVPVEFVECFFAGRAATHLPSPAGQPHATKAWSVVVRLAESAKDWHARPVTAAWGEWREGYITIRGTWCEPIDPEVLKVLNHRLATAHRQRQARGG